jgi:hypothetical protein
MAWSHPNVARWMPRGNVGPFRYHPTVHATPVPIANAIPAMSNDRVWEISEMVPSSWHNDLKRLTEESEWSFDLSEDRES